MTLYHVDQLVWLADTLLLEDVTQDILLPGPGLVNGFTNADMDHPVAQ